ncbi:MAG: hypothetical protein Q4F97_01840 [Bacteroidales bacterium]|nr:hypothetical protein [Bacteroidales bacterium]
MTDIDNELNKFINESKKEYHANGLNKPAADFSDFAKNKNINNNVAIKKNYSIWWIAAASFIGIIVGMIIPTPSKKPVNLLAVNDTVFITQKDTVYIEEKGSSKSDSSNFKTPQNDDDIIKSETLRNDNKSSKTDEFKNVKTKETLPATGKSLSQEEFNIGLLVSNTSL